MEKQQGIWEETWTIPAYMIGPDQSIKIYCIADIFQTIAGNHADFLGLGYQQMQDADKFWILSRMRMEISEKPKWKEQIKIESWISTRNGPFSHRNFAMYNSSNNVMVKASYLWTLLDKSSMRPSKIEDGIFVILDRLKLLAKSPKRIKIKNESLLSTTFQSIKHSDLDIIGHTNNVQYIRMALDTVGDKIDDVKAFEINYHKETFAGEQLKILNYRSETESHQIQILYENDNTDVCKMEIYL